MKEFSEVRAIIGGIRGVLQKLNDAPPDGKWNPMTYCPFCRSSKTASVYNRGGVDYFICHQKPGSKHAGCCTGNRSLTETSYIALRLGLSEQKPSTGGPSPAYQKLLELAGCWEQRDAAPNKPKPAAKPPEAGDGAPPATPGATVLPAAPAAPVPAAQPAPGNVPPISPTPPAAGELPMEVECKPSDDEKMLGLCIEIIRVENKASVRLFQKHLKLGYPRATRMMDELEKRGVVGPAKGAEPRDVIKLPERPAGLVVVKIDDEITFHQDPKAGVPLDAAKAAGGEAPAATPGAAVLPAPAAPAAPGPASPAAGNAPPQTPQLPPGVAAMRWLFTKLFPTESEMKPYLQDGSPVPSPLPEKVARKLLYKPVPLFVTRGLTSATCEAVGLRANPSKANEAVLQEMSQQFPWEEARASGTWLEGNRKLNLGRRPNAQFHGKGQVGRKPENERKDKDDKHVWGFCEPVIIPYFDEAGDVIKLRPHKGGAPGGTAAGRPRIYVPRDYRKCADIVEKFYTVVICEGEYKAMAIWQTLGRGALLQVDAEGRPLVDATQFEAIGVCALPGISYVTNVEMRMDLERWLADVGARRVIVAFDDEDKSDKPMRQRFDAQRDARVLATELSQLLHVDARVCVLPREWRNAKGKADWDGALVKLIGAGEPPTAKTSNIQHSTNPK